MSRKKSIDLTNLPEVPEIPENCGSSNKKFTLKSENNEQLVTMLSNLKEREMSFYENIRAFNGDVNDINQVADMSSNNKNNNLTEDEEQCRDYLSPLMNRTQTSIVQLIQIKESLHQLDSLHQIVEQLLMVQEQNYQMRKRLKTVKTLSALKEMEIQINSDPEKFMKSSGFFEDGSDIENEGEFEQNMQDLEAMLAASKSASNKRNASKKHRSKSIISEENSMPLKENNRNYPLRRQSAVSDFKPKVSKWTKVKAAFKWEKTNTLHLSESKSSDSILSPNNDNYKNFLKVPSTQAACQSCSGDSVISTSSGKVLTATTPEISSAHSSDENDEMIKARNFNFIRPPSFHDDERRSHSLDGELTFGANSQSLEKSNSKNSKSAWSKVKGIVTNRNSRKSIKSTDSASRDISPIDIIEVQSDSVSSPNHSSSSPNNFNLGVPEIDLCPTSDENENKRFDDGRLLMRSSVKQPRRSSKKSKLIPEIESLPEDEAFESSKSRQLPSPLILKKDLSETDSVEGTNITPNLKKFFYPKNLSVSDPNSPLKTQEFFSENDFSSGADNDYSFSFSEPLSPLKRGSNNSSRSSRQQDEIMKNYHELQRKIKLEFENKQQEWSKIRPLMVQLNNSVPSYLKEEDLSLPSTPKNAIENLMLNEENLSADFKRKLEEWRVKKGQQSGSGKKQAPDWQLWKTGQMKFENQGLIALPDAKDLPEEFQKKLNEWKQMKAEGRSPPYNHQTSVQEKLKRQFSKTDKSSSSNESSMKRTKTQSTEACEEELPPQLKSIKSANEIVVQTSDGLMKFKGISRSFTRKLYEWEKAKGIEPESDSSTFAFLHPKYQVQVDEYESNDLENGCMKRALSVDSIKPVPHSSQMSHQPSSLSLNDADNLKEPNEKKASSDIEIYCDGKRKEDSMLEEPEAVIVEVEDEGLDLTPMPSLSASSQLQIPVFKFDFAHKDLKSEAEADFSRTFNDVKQLLEELKMNFSSFNDSRSISDEGIKHLNVKLKILYDLLSQLKQFKKRSTKDELEISVTLSKELFEMLNDYDNYSSNASQNFFLDMSGKLIKIEECLKSIDYEKFQATTSIQNSEDKGIATIFHTPTFICNSVKVDESTTNNVMHLKVSSESEMPELSTEDVRSDEKSSKKVVRNASSSSKRKIRLRRMGSRQNSKTESDSDEEYAQIPEAQRKLKRKSSRAKKQLDSDKSIDSFQGEEEVVYVFKIKPGETNEVITKTSENSNTVNHTSESSSILISPTENCVELIEASANDLICQGTYANPIVKTKRKIFTPIEVDSVNNKNSSTVISHEIESSSASSDKSDKEKSSQEEEITKVEVGNTSEESSHAKTHESGAIEKSDIIKRADLAPSIRLMIEKYHQNIEQKSTSNSNSSSPLWLSPVLDRRVRKQSAEYQFKIMKSNSFQEINEEEDVCEKIENETPKTSTAVAIVEEQTVINIDLPPQTQSATGCIPKIPKNLPKIQVETDEVVHKRSESEKPKTPLSERALKIKQAKEAFFRSTVSPFKDEQTNWNYRLSQISVGSTDSNSIENMSCSTSMLPTNDPVVKVIDEENKTSSLPRNVSSTASTSEFERDSQKHSKFGLSTLATKLRKVKLKRGPKEVQKMNTVPVLCRQSLNVNLFSNQSSTSESQPQSSRQLKKPSDDSVMKSKSLGNF
ncbi:hypothetical protein PVAND_001970 [Polypedilum vanderplanki]|uniref:Uncharacterized protein n=1 Tax=Polypedilum vanderplanki TaxID=319348 RepID=A0A9J6BPV7_POLVA|nr:hypothetical protein PVAND_001970 [Polypedilum vanderplanki]